MWAQVLWQRRRAAHDGSVFARTGTFARRRFGASLGCVSCICMLRMRPLKSEMKSASTQLGLPHYFCGFLCSPEADPECSVLIILIHRILSLHVNYNCNRLWPVFSLISAHWYCRVVLLLAAIITAAIQNLSAANTKINSLAAELQIKQCIRCQDFKIAC